MNARLLAVITPGDEATVVASMAGLATIARAAEAEVRLAYFRPLPPPRVDRHDRPIADTDAEMTRIAGVATRLLGAAARVFPDVPVETVVRFGTPRREVAVEAEAYVPQIVVVFAASRGVITRFRTWALRRRLGRRSGLRLLVLAAAPRPGGRRASGVNPAPGPSVASPARRE